MICRLLWLFLFPIIMAETLRLGAFNVQTFGQSKAGKPAVMDTLGKIITRYDILLLMEIRDAKGTAIKQLLETANKESHWSYEMELSDRLGRTVSKEQYAFLYRKDRGISVRARYQYDDGPEDLFQREPFVVLFHVESAVVQDFALIALHTEPKMAVTELKALIDVYYDVKKRWKIDDVIILGDLNADCKYVSRKAWSTIPIRQKSEFYWPISDDVDTTVKDTDCAYDRFIVTGKDLINSIVPESAHVFNFQKTYGLSQTQALAVSDHFPIELRLQEKQRTDGGPVYTSLNIFVLTTVTCIVIKLCRS